jgi:hypothetical protein
MTYTSLDVHDILREGFRSPMFNGIKSMGPRYCPSIEDKINRFAQGKDINCLSNRKVGKLVRYTVNFFNFTSCRHTI